MAGRFFAPQMLPKPGGGTTRVFRHVGPDELADIQATGRFNLGQNSTGKYFADTPEHAAQWGEWLSKGQGAVVETRLSDILRRSTEAVGKA